MSTEDVATEPRTSDEIVDELERRGHVITSWEEIGSFSIPANSVSVSQYRIGNQDEASPTVFRAIFPPGSRVEAHTHACDYSEIILQGSQKVGGKWLHEGDIRIGLAHKAYGPLIAGPDGVTVLLIFANGLWPAIPVGAGEGATLGTDDLLERFGSS